MFRSLTAPSLLPFLAFSLWAAPHAGARQEAGEPRVSLTLGEGSLELTATWEPLTDTVYKFETQFPWVAELQPVAERARYDMAQFRAFLPKEAVAVGELWRVDAKNVLPFLQQFHPGATANMHHDGGFGVSAPGAWACLRAIDSRYAEVRLRVHADFLLDGDGSRGSSSWFTPAQFDGSMLIDRAAEKVVAFRLEVPQQSANVDVNIATRGTISADIGRIPRMDLIGGVFPEDRFASEATSNAEESVTKTSITKKKADNLLARKFYPLAEIEWLDLAAARVESKASGKPLHVVNLFGSLMDESC